MIADAGFAGRESELRDENRWFHYETKRALWEAAAIATEDPQIAEHVGESFLELGVGFGLKRAIRALGSPQLVYRNVPRVNSKFNFTHSMKLVERGPKHVHFEYRDIAGVGYHHFDCDYALGLLRVVPALFGLGTARVVQSKCGAHGADHCEFDVRWAGGARQLKWSALAVGASAAAAIPVAALLDPGLLGPGLAVAGVLVGAAGTRLAVLMRRRIAALEALLRQQDVVAEAQLASLATLSADLRLEEVLDRIAARAGDAIGGAQFALVVDERGVMRADRHSDIPARTLEQLEQWVQRSRPVLREGPLVIDDLAGVQSLEALAADDELPLGSACAAPLNFRGELLGALIALAPGARVFLPHDVRELETYAGHAAIALSNARLVGALERAAAEDPLTGVANQRVFRHNCAAELLRAARDDASVAFVALDLDHFKQINDTFGHPFGDQVLVSVAGALRSVIRGHDTVARIGGEEFALLLPGADCAQALEIAQRALAAIAEIPLPGGRLSCSAGVASTSGARAPECDLFGSADRALYEAKRAGRGRAAVAG